MKPDFVLGRWLNNSHQDWSEQLWNNPKISPTALGTQNWLQFLETKENFSMEILQRNWLPLGTFWHTEWAFLGMTAVGSLVSLNPIKKLLGMKFYCFRKFSNNIRARRGRGEGAGRRIVGEATVANQRRAFSLFKFLAFPPTRLS